jgi:hypothetical protein
MKVCMNFAEFQFATIFKRFTSPYMVKMRFTHFFFDVEQRSHQTHDSRFEIILQKRMAEIQNLLQNTQRVGDSPLSQH